MILSESKRDDLLLPYMEMLRAKGINCTLGQFKSYMLKKLTNEGRMRNLSLASNFYLAGAVRYYFNGDLTFNKDLSVFKDDPSAMDEWNDDVCQKLNALIKILRNSYIDTIGTTFEQPEDFGTLTLPKLLKKYNKKITTELENGSDFYADTSDMSDNLNRDEHVGNGYTFDILYSYQEATKYNKATEPGAWCITYGPQHYQSYIKRLGIHYVIFRKDGWENVPRQKGPEWTTYKPQDEYGCSLIAVLQSNNTGEPIFITSRWNHGYSSDNSHCEADHAFTKQEFFAKTGVTDKDLQRIFEIWKKDYPLKSTDNYSENDSSPISKEEKLRVTRELKYAQMRINGGDLNVDNSIKIIMNLNGEQDEIINGTAKITKGIYWCRNNFETNHTFFFLMDKGKIIFETLTAENDVTPCSSNIKGVRRMYPSFKILNNYENLVAIIYKRYVLLYDIRRHSLITIDGIFKFKGIPTISDISGINKSTIFYVAAVGKQQFAVLNLATNQPLKLPNGSYWVNQYLCSGDISMTYYSNVFGNTNIHMKPLGGGEGCVMELIYDSSSGERYFYDIDNKRFLSQEELPIIEPDEDTGKARYAHIYTKFYLPGYIAYALSYNIDAVNHWNCDVILTKNGKTLTLMGKKYFSKLVNLGHGYIGLEYGGYYNKIGIFYNLFEDKPMTCPETGDVFKYSHLDFGNDRYDSKIYESRLIFLKKRSGWDVGDYIFDKKEHKFLKNLTEKPTKYQFFIAKKGHQDGSGVMFKLTYNAPSPYLEDNPEWRQYYRRLYVPGVDNSDIYAAEPSSWYGGVPLDIDTVSDANITRDDLAYMVTETIKRILQQKND